MTATTRSFAGEAKTRVDRHEFRASQSQTRKIESKDAHYTQSQGMESLSVTRKTEKKSVGTHLSSTMVAMRAKEEAKLNRWRICATNRSSNGNLKINLRRIPSATSAASTSSACELNVFRPHQRVERTSLPRKREGYADVNSVELITNFLCLS